MQLISCQPYFLSVHRVLPPSDGRRGAVSGDGWSSAPTVRVWGAGRRRPFMQERQRHDASLVSDTRLLACCQRRRRRRCRTGSLPPRPPARYSAGRHLFPATSPPPSFSARRSLHLRARRPPTTPTPAHNGPLCSHSHQYVTRKGGCAVSFHVAAPFDIPYQSTARSSRFDLFRQCRWAPVDNPSVMPWWAKGSAHEHWLCLYRSFCRVKTLFVTGFCNVNSCSLWHMGFVLQKNPHFLGWFIEKYHIFNMQNP